MRAPIPLYRAHLRGAQPRLVHFARLAFMTIIFVIMACFALAYALGYKVDWSAHRIFQTSTILLSSPRGRVAASIRLDGRIVADHLPARLTYLSPGHYSLSVEKPGFQVWNRNLNLNPNEASVHTTIVLMREPPIAITANSDWLPTTVSPVDDGLEIRGSELWVNGTFTTRVSGFLVAAHWYPGGHHVAYQVNGTIWLLELDGLTTQKLLSTSVTEAIPFVFHDNGRSLVYREGQEVKALNLTDH